MALGFVGDENQQPSDRDEALAHFRGEFALAADGLQQDGVEFRRAGAVALEDIVRDLVDLDADALENVGAAVDHRVEQIDEDASRPTPWPGNSG